MTIELNAATALRVISARDIFFQTQTSVELDVSINFLSFLRLLFLHDIYLSRRDNIGTLKVLKDIFGR